MTWSSEVFRIFLSRDVKDKFCKNLNVSNIFCGLPPPTSFCTLITPIAVSGGWAGYSWVYDSVGTDSHNDYRFYLLDDPNTSAYPDLSNEMKFYYNDPDGNRYSNGGQVDSTVTFYGHSSITDPYFGKVYEALPIF